MTLPSVFNVERFREPGSIYTIHRKSRAPGRGRSRHIRVEVFKVTLCRVPGAEVREWLAGYTTEKIPCSYDQCSPSTLRLKIFKMASKMAGQNLNNLYLRQYSSHRRGKRLPVSARVELFVSVLKSACKILTLRRVEISWSYFPLAGTKSPAAVGQILTE